MDGGSSCVGLDLPQPLPSSYTTTGGHQQFFSALLEGHTEHDGAVGSRTTACAHAVARITVVRIAHELVTAGQGNLKGPARPQRNFKGQKGAAWEGGYRAPCVVRWPGHIKPATVKNQLFAALDWVPTFVDIAGGPAGERLKK